MWGGEIKGWYELECDLLGGIVEVKEENVVGGKVIVYIRAT